MTRLLQSLALAALLVALAPSLSNAQTQQLAQDTQRPFSSELRKVTHYVKDYTRAVVLGVVGGGALMNVMVGGVGATVFGAVVGLGLGELFFIVHDVPDTPY